MAADTVIRGGLIVDGSGGAPFQGDVVIRDGVIAEVGRVRESASRVIDAQGLAVAPGFWDVHTHYDAQLLWDPIATSSCWHGVTTIVQGNCGFTVAPCRPDDQEWLVKMLARVEGMDAGVLRRTLPWPWQTFGEYLDTLDRRLGVNVMAHVGHSTVRRYVLGPEASERAATPDEVASMRQALRQSLREGGMGFTTSRAVTHWDGDGLPVPSRAATLDEYFALLEELRTLKAGFVQGALHEFNRHRYAEVARVSGRPVCWNTIAQRPDQPDLWRGQLQRMLEMRDQGVPFFALGQALPIDLEFTFDGTNIFDRWPTWQKFQIEPRDKKIAIMRDPAMRARLRQEMSVDPIRSTPHRWDQAVLARSPTGKYRHYEGERLADVALAVGKDSLDAAFDMSLDEELKTHFRVVDARRQDPDAMVEILRTAHVVPGMSDAGAHTTSEINTGFPTHILGSWVRERQVMTLQEAVRKLSAACAEEIGVTDRGRIQVGMAADIAVFDPRTVAAGDRVFVNDMPGGQARLVQYAQGIEYTLVNGVVTLERGKVTGDLGGRTLRSGEYRD